VIVEVVTGADERPEVRVVDTDDLTALRLALGQVTDEEADDVLREAGLGRLEDAGTAWLDAGALRAAAEPDADVADWPQRWGRHDRDRPRARLARRGRGRPARARRECRGRLTRPGGRRRAGLFPPDADSGARWSLWSLHRQARM
jgi:hypothetical protein